MARIILFIQSKNKIAGIYVRLRDGRKIDAKAKTRFSINPKDWSNSKGKPSNLKDESLKKLNQDLSLFHNELLVYYNNREEHVEVNSKWLYNFISPPQTQNDIPLKLIEYIDYYIRLKQNNLSKASITKYTVFKHLLERFQIWSKNEYYIKDIDANFKLEIEKFCKEEKYSQNTISRQFKFIKTITRRTESCYLLLDFRR